jgi:hypothetical protein
MHLRGAQSMDFEISIDLETLIGLLTLIAPRSEQLIQTRNHESTKTRKGSNLKGRLSESHLTKAVSPLGLLSVLLIVSCFRTFVLS